MKSKLIKPMIWVLVVATLTICSGCIAKPEASVIEQAPIPSTPIYTEIEIEEVKPAPSVPEKTPTTEEIKPSEPIVEPEIEVEAKPEIKDEPVVEPEPEPEEPVEDEPAIEEKPETDRLPCTDDVYKVVNGITVTYRELHMLGLTIYGEANGQTKMEQAAVAWSILNRVDNADGVDYARGRSLTYVITFPGYAPGQIHGYWNTKGVECPDYYLELARDVVDRWALEHEGAENVGRVLPKEYTYWTGKKDKNGVWHNYFRTAYKTNEPRWDWSLPNPYEE